MIAVVKHGLLSTLFWTVLLLWDATSCSMTLLWVQMRMLLLKVLQRHLNRSLRVQIVYARLHSFKKTVLHRSQCCRCTQ